MEGVQHGPGALMRPGGSEARGIWYGGSLRHGWVKIIMPNGDRYEGDYKEDHVEGQGTFYFANGDQCVAEWEKNIIIGAGSGMKNGRKMYCFGRVGLKGRKNTIVFEK